MHLCMYANIWLERDEDLLILSLFVYAEEHPVFHLLESKRLTILF